MKIPLNTRPFLIFLMVILISICRLPAQVESDTASDVSNVELAVVEDENLPTKMVSETAVEEGDSAGLVVLTTAQLDSVQQGIDRGRNLYTGNTRFKHGGPSCLACHNVASADVMDGGLLAKDLTHVYQRLGDAGIEAMLVNPGFPAMARAFENKKLTTEEIRDLKTFLQYVQETSPEGEPKPDHSAFIYGGGIGLIVWMLLISLMYMNRKRGSVKAEIFNRQTKSMN